MEGIDNRQESQLLKMRGITKFFPGVKALDNVDLDLNQGEVLAVIGENGAGKSTLMKILGGVHQPDAGEVILEGKRQLSIRYKLLRSWASLLSIRN